MHRGRLIAIFALFALVAVAVPQAADAKKRGMKFGERTLKRGSHGRDVRVLQDFLTRAGHSTAVDGHFGYGTYSTVRSWEGANGLRVDGKVTKKDARRLRALVTATPKAIETPDTEVQEASPADAADTGGAGFVEVAAASKGTVEDGLGVAPADAPQAVKDIIAAGNAIAFKPYRYGGGHGSFKDSGYDCSGSLSYALNGGGLLKSPLDSTGFESWGLAGPGAWVTVYANAGHAYMVVAGLRFDTSGAKQRGGSRWTTEQRSSAGFVARHPRGL